MTHNAPRHALAPLSQAIEAVELHWTRLQECLGARDRPGGLQLDFRAYEETQDLLSARLRDLGLKVFQLHKLGVFEPNHPAPDDPPSTPEPIKTASPDVPEPAPAEAPTPQPAELTKEALSNLRLALKGYDAPSDPPQPAPPPSYAPKAHEAWRLARDTTPKVKTAMTFKREYSALQSLISADYFNTSWAELPEGLLQRLYKFYAARARYLRELPSRLRPTHAKGDGAFESLLVQLRQAGGDLAERALRPYPPKSNWRGEMQALRAQLDEDFASPYDPSKQPTPEFNPERAFEALKELVELNANLPLIQDKAREMLERGVSPADPRMIAILRDHAGDLSGPRFKSLRAKIRKAIRDEAKRAVETPAPTQIPCAGALDGKRIALIGGDRRGTLTTWLQQQLPHAEIDWVETSRRSGVRQAQALVDRMNHGGVDFVLLIQEFMGHHISGSIIEAAKGAHSSVCVTYVRNGYGQAQVIEALERCLSQEDDRP